MAQNAQALAAPAGALALAGAGANAGAGESGALSPGADYATKVDRVRGLVDQDPERVAQVVKHWVSADE
jgi:flagellar biosynthesis/type III secretory pathway M-ring protein FliF/YscJ